MITISDDSLGALFNLLGNNDSHRGLGCVNQNLLNQTR